MSEESSSEDRYYRVIIYLATPYAFLCAILYLLSFWSTFKINYLEYISLADILKVAIYPIIGSTLGIITGLLLSDFNEVTAIKKEKKTPLFKKKDYRTILVLCVISLLFINIANIFWMFSGLIGFIAANRLQSNPKIKNLIPNNSILWTTIFLIFTLPLLSYSYGLKNSYDLKMGYNVYYAKTSQFKDRVIFGEQALVKYIGFADKHLFFTSLDNSNLYIVNSDNIDIFELSNVSDKNKTQIEVIISWLKKRLPTQ
jgi:hypothetical protein